MALGSWCRSLVASISKDPDQREPEGIRARIRGLLIVGITCAWLAVAATALGTALVYVPQFEVSRMEARLTPVQIEKFSPVERESLLNDCRRTLAQELALASVILSLAVWLVGLYQKHGDNRTRRAEREHERERLFDDRYEKAVDQLGSSAVITRVGAIHALGRLVRESPEHHWMVVKLLTEFVREHAKRKVHIQPSSGRLTTQSCPIDVQNAMIVLGRRPRRPEAGVMDFSSCELPGVDLSGGNFAGAIFHGADLRGARFGADDLLDADLRHAVLGIVEHGVSGGDRSVQESVARAAQDIRRGRLFTGDRPSVRGPSYGVTEELLVAERLWEQSYGRPARPRTPMQPRRYQGERRRGDDRTAGARTSGPYDSPL